MNLAFILQPFLLIGVWAKVFLGHFITRFCKNKVGLFEFLDACLKLHELAWIWKLFTTLLWNVYNLPPTVNI